MSKKHFLSKKHFREIAREMHEEYISCPVGSQASVLRIAEALCPTFLRFNSAFRRSTFLYAVKNGL